MPRADWITASALKQEHKEGRETCLLRFLVPACAIRSANRLPGAADGLGLIVTPRFLSSSTMSLALGLPCWASFAVPDAIVSREARSFCDDWICASCPWRRVCSV